MSAGHRWDDHTADLALTVWGDDETQMLLEAAQAVLAEAFGPLEETEALARSPLRVDVSALDPADRLVRWINEVLYHAMVEGRRAVSASLRLADPGALEGELQTVPIPEGTVVHEIKAASYHEVSVTADPARVQGHVVLDV